MWQGNFLNTFQDLEERINVYIDFTMRKKEFR